MVFLYSLASIPPFAFIKEMLNELLLGNKNPVLQKDTMHKFKNAPFYQIHSDSVACAVTNGNQGFDYPIKMSCSSLCEGRMGKKC